MKKKTLLAIAATGIAAFVIKKLTKKKTPVATPRTHHITNAFSKAKEVAVHSQEV